MKALFLLVSMIRSALRNRTALALENLSDLTHKSAKSLMRMLGPRGNPQARNLFEVIAHLQKSGGLRLQLALKRG